MENRIERIQTSRPLSTQRKKFSAESALIAVELGKVAAILGEPMNADRQELLTEELSDLPVEALQYATRQWLRGDRSHLSSFEQESTRVGVFFPKPAELRAIADVFLRKQRAERRAQERRESEERDRRHREENPEEYVATTELQSKIDKMNARLGLTAKVIEMPTRPYVELVREEVMRLTIPDLEALLYALRLREPHRTQMEDAVTA